MAEKDSEKALEDGKNSPNCSFLNTCSNTINTSHSGSIFNIDKANFIATASADATVKNSLLHISDRTKIGNTSDGKFSGADEQPTLRKTFLHLFQGSSKTLQKKLKNLYSGLQIPTPVWMEDRPDCPIEEHFVSLELKSMNEEITINNIFKNITKHKRILIEGKPGFGKTTLVTKIANDWALNQKYLDKIEFLFLLEIRHLRDKTIDEGIIDEAKNAGFEDKEIQTILKMSKRKTLVIIDGLDESTPNQRENILKVLYKQKYPEMIVLVTCRTGYFTLDREEENKLFKGKSKRKKLFDREIKVQGITKNNRKSFLCRFTTLNDKDQEKVERILEEKKFQLEIFESPLLLFLLADFVNEASKVEKEITNLTSVTNFYKIIFNLIIRRSEERHQNVLNDDFDVFTENEMTKPYRQILNQFGSDSIDHFLRNELVFSESVLITKIQQLGLVVKEKNDTRTRTTTSFEVFHLSILEFVVAFYLYQEFERNNFKEFNPIFEHKMNEVFIQSGKTSLIFPFLMGLLKDRVVNFFKAIKPHSYIYSFDVNVLYEMVQNIDVSEEKMSELLQIFQYFIPPKFNLDDMCSSYLWQRLISKRIEDAGVDCVFWKTSAMKLTRAIRNVPIFWFYLKQNAYEEENISLFARLPTQRRGLYCYYLNDETNDLLLSHLKEGILKNIKIDVFRFYTETFECIELTERLLYHHRLTSLDLASQNISEMNQIINVLCNTKHNLDSIRILNESGKIFLIDLNKFTNEGQKHWKNITVSNILFLCIKPLKSCIDCFMYDGNDFNVTFNAKLTDLTPNAIVEKEFSITSIVGRRYDSLKTKELNQVYLSIIQSLKNLSLVSFEIKSNCFFSALQSAEQWSTKSLKELILNFVTKFDYEIAKSVRFWENLNSFTHLNFLELSFQQDSHNLLPVEEIVQCISRRPITHLLLWGIGLQISLLSELISQLLNSKTLRLKTLTLQADKIFSESEEIMNKLLILLETKRLVKFCLICHIDSNVWHLVLSKVLKIKRKKFCVKHDMFGSDAVDPIFSKRLYTDSPYFKYKRISVSF